MSSKEIGAPFPVKMRRKDFSKRRQGLSASMSLEVLLSRNHWTKRNAVDLEVASSIDGVNQPLGGCSNQTRARRLKVRTKYSSGKIGWYNISNRRIVGSFWSISAVMPL